MALHLTLCLVEWKPDGHAPHFPLCVTGRRPSNAPGLGVRTPLTTYSSGMHIFTIRTTLSTVRTHSTRHLTE